VCVMQHDTVHVAALSVADTAVCICMCVCVCVCVCVLCTNVCACACVCMCLYECCWVSERESV